MTAPSDTVMVRLRDVVPELLLDVKYATPNNFTRRVLYPSADLMARRIVAVRLAAVQQALRPRSLQVKVFDAYRPLSVQHLMWSIVPDERYVADPKKGSRHNRGAALDLTICDMDGRELDMGSGYDEFTERAHMDYAGCTPAQRANRALLQLVMNDAGFTVLPTEWWHYDLVGWERFAILDE
jgi:D-alanyl-D-alanine dipeptidase